MRLLKSVILVISFTILSFELINNSQHYFTSKALSGDYITEQKPVLKPDVWFSGKFQNVYSHWYENNISIHPELVRLRNQLDYSLFKIIHGQDIIVGTDNMLFHKPYCVSYVGEDLIDSILILSELRKLKFVQEELLKRNIQLLYVISPSKPYYFKGFLPENYKNQTSKTNYDFFSKYLIDLNINHIDYNKWFVNAKDTSAYALFPKYGTHWSCYGAALAADSMIKYVSKLTSRLLPSYTFLSGKTTITALETDNDMFDLMNLFSVKHDFELYYPKIKFDDLADSLKPSVLIVGTSFIWNWMGVNSFFKHEFNSRSYFWYYNRGVYLDYKKLAPVSQKEKLNFADEIYSKQIILIESNTFYLKDFNSGFIDDLYNLLISKSSTKS